MDKFKIDSHKLIYHVEKVHAWKNGENIYPIYIEISLHQGCNHQCIFCAFDYLDKTPNSLDTDCLRQFIKQAAEKEVRSILFSGEGEPLLHPSAPEIIALAKTNGIDVALSTNGVLLSKQKSETVLPYLSWIRISLNAGSKQDYELIHGTQKSDFDTVLTNLRNAVAIKRKHNYSSTIGVQYLLIPNNYKNAETIAALLQKIGIDYLVFKPYSPHPSSHHELESTIDAETLATLETRLKKYSTKNFQVIFRKNAFQKLQKQKTYSQCFGLSFITHIATTGEVYPCNAFVGNPAYAFGNICKNTIQEIWEGDRRKDILAKIHAKNDLTNCRQSCRMDEINQYLWELKHPGEHINFI